MNPSPAGPDSIVLIHGFWVTPRSYAKHYKSETTLTEVKEYAGRSHLMPAQEGWEEVADYALEWAEKHARMPAAR